MKIQYLGCSSNLGATDWNPILLYFIVFLCLLHLMMTLLIIYKNVFLSDWFTYWSLHSWFKRMFTYWFTIIAETFPLPLILEGVRISSGIHFALSIFVLAWSHVNVSTSRIWEFRHHGYNPSSFADILTFLLLSTCTELLDIVQTGKCLLTSVHTFTAIIIYMCLNATALLGACWCVGDILAPNVKRLYQDFVLLIVN